MNLDRERLRLMSANLLTDLKNHVSDSGRLAVVKAPPGSGKTYTLLSLVEDAYQQGMRVAIATQTNSQADGVCERLAKHHPGVLAFRFAAGGSNRSGSPVPVATREADLPSHCVAVGTVAKWSMINIHEPFHVLMVDEAWQMAWADFMLLGQVAPKFVLIGDPGQIPPVVSIPVERWETSPRAPHIPAPELILADPSIQLLSRDLPSCRRLPADAVELIAPFYDFSFESWAQPGERYVAAPRATDGGDRVDPAIDSLSEGSVTVLAVETPDDGPPFEQDSDTARLAAHTAIRLLDRGAQAAFDDSGESVELEPTDIGICATHRVMNSAIERALPAKYRVAIRVDTAERWQGLERKVMIMVHPLSSIVHPSAFDLHTGRLCVMASRHLSGLIVISRDHVPDTLTTHIPNADQAVGRPDVTGRGHQQHEYFWGSLDQNERITRVA